MSDCIFCRIVNDEISSIRVYEDDDFIAFLDNSPVRLGHLLLIPKQHIPYVIDMPDDLYQKYMALAKRISQAIKNVTNPKRIGLGVIGFDVDHAHIHLIPLESSKDISITASKDMATVKQKQLIAQKISQAI